MSIPDFANVYEGQWDRNGLDYLALIDQWHVVGRSDNVPIAQPVPVKLLGEKLVLWRAEGGKIQAWLDFCAHRGAPLSLGKVRDCKLACPYHGWHFDAAGRCVHVPAHPDHAPPDKRVVRCFRATEKYGFVWVSLGNPQFDVPRLPQWDADSYRKVSAGPYMLLGAFRGSFFGIGSALWGLFAGLVFSGVLQWSGFANAPAPEPPVRTP